MRSGGGGRRNLGDDLPRSLRSAFRADQLRFPFLLKRQRPSEQRRGCGVGASPLRPLGLTGSSAMNSAQQNSDLCGSSASSWWQLAPLPLTGAFACPLPLAWRPLPSTSSTVGPVASWWPFPLP